MKRTVLVLGLLFSALPHANAFELTPGLWETTTTIDAPGIPEGMGKQVHQNCLSADRAAHPEKALRDSVKEGECGAPETNRSGDTLNWSMTCTMPGSNTKTHIRGEMVMHNDKHYSQTMTMKGKQHSVTTQTDAKWVGACKK